MPREKRNRRPPVLVEPSLERRVKVAADLDSWSSVSSWIRKAILEKLERECAARGE